MSIGKSTKLGDPNAPIRRRLDRAQVLEAARALADVSGVDAMSIKQLAEKLGIQPPSVYAHFAGLTELRRELALWSYRAITAQMLEAAVGLAGKDALLALAHAYLDFIRNSPGLYSAIVATPPAADTELYTAGRAWLAPFERVLESLGLAADDVVHALRGIRSIVHGFGMLETEGSFRTAVDSDTSFRRVLQTFVEGVEHHRDAEPTEATPKPGPMSAASATSSSDPPTRCAQTHPPPRSPRKA